MKQSVCKFLFVTTAFLLGSCEVLYDIEVYIFMVFAFLVNLKYDYQGFCQYLKKEKYYVIWPLVGVGYFIIHFLISKYILDITYRASWGVIEKLLLFFFFIPIYVLSAKSFLDVRLLKKFLLFFCLGVLLFNVVNLFYLTQFSLFTSFKETINDLYTSRFGMNKDMLGGHMYLEPVALYLAITSVISYFFVITGNFRTAKKTVLGYIAILILALLFLSFTVTKGAILAFLGGIVLLSVWYFRKLSLRTKFIFVFSFVLILGLGYLFMPESYKVRMHAAVNEIENIRNDQYKGGSIAPRAGLMKENFSHFEDFALFGLGVYKRDVTGNWYENSKYPIQTLTNAHNSFVEFWLIGGIPYLAYILFLFGAPVYKMFKQKKYSFLLLSIILTLFIANNTCVLIILVDSSSMVLFFLSMAYLYQPLFRELEIERCCVRSTGKGLPSQFQE